MQRIGMLVAQPAAWQALRESLMAARYDVAIAVADPEPLDSLLEEHDPDVVLVELGLGLYPLDYLHARRCRQQEAVKPLVILALARPEHLTPANFVVGVDEFVLPPYAPAEVLARLQLVSWRLKRIDAENMVRIGGLTIDLATRQVCLDGEPLELSSREYELLTFLASHRDRAFSRDALLRHVWGSGFEGEDRVVDQYVRRLRSKLGMAHSPTIETVRGLGYRLAAVRPISSQARGAPRHTSS